MVNAIATYENTETGMKTYVTAGAKGFHVSMQDLDSGEFISAVTIYKNAADAIAKAKEVLS
jgi:hypothetical protein